MVVLFKRGDVVWATKNCYGVTKYHVPCKVIDMYGDGDIRVVVKARADILEFVVDGSLFEKIKTQFI